MDRIWLTNAKVYQEHGWVDGGVLIEDGVIVAVEPGRETAAGDTDLQGAYLVPGFLDLHTHGAAGFDVNASDTAQLLTIGRFFAAHGVTGWNASILTDTYEQTLWCLAQARQASQQSGTARLLGVHLEGPFLSPEYKGAMPEALLRQGDPALFQTYQDAAGGLISYMTVSPEVPGVPALIEQISSQIVVALGHSGADYDTAMTCIRAGAKSATHTANAMRLLHQHEPAILGAVLESDVYCEMICDGRHLHPGIVRLLIKCKGLDRVVAVTDSIQAAGLPDGNYRLGVNDVVVRDGDAKLASNGVRAGSTLTMDQALRNLYTFTGLPLETLLPILTENPAKLMGWQDRKGSIAPGKDADLTVLDQHLQVAATYVGGQCVYHQ